MPITVECSNCHAVLKVPDDRAGRKGKCLRCKAPIEVPPLGKKETKPATAVVKADPPVSSPVAAARPKPKKTSWVLIENNVSATRAVAQKEKGPLFSLFGIDITIVRLIILIVLVIAGVVVGTYDFMPAIRVTGVQPMSGYVVVTSGPTYHILTNDHPDGGLLLVEAEVMQSALKKAGATDRNNYMNISKSFFQMRQNDKVIEPKLIVIEKSENQQEFSVEDVIKYEPTALGAAAPVQIDGKSETQELFSGTLSVTCPHMPPVSVAVFSGEYSTSAHVSWSGEAVYRLGYESADKKQEPLEIARWKLGLIFDRAELESGKMYLYVGKRNYAKIKYDDAGWKARTPVSSP